MTTPLFLLRCKQLGLSMTELDLLTIGLINDMFTERENDDYDGWNEVAGQAVFGFHGMDQSRCPFIHDLRISF